MPGRTEEDAANVYGYTGTLRANIKGESVCSALHTARTTRPASCSRWNTTAPPRCTARGTGRPARYCSPRHSMHFKSIIEGSTRAEDMAGNMCLSLSSGKAHLKDEGDPKPAASATAGAAAGAAAVNGDVSGGGGEKSKGPAAGHHSTRRLSFPLSFIRRMRP